MSTKKRFGLLGMFLIVVLILAGCSKEQQVLFEANMKMQDVESFQQQVNLDFELKGSGFDGESQKQLDTLATYVNDATMNMNMKTVFNEDKTKNKSQMDLKLALPDMSMSMPVWLEGDLNGEKANIVEIMKPSQIMKQSLPEEYAKKDYLVLDFNELSAAGMSGLDMTKLAELSKNMTTKQAAFLEKFSEKYNPDVTVLSKGKTYVKTDEGQEYADTYEVKLNDAQLKDFIRYSVNTFAQDQEAMKYLKDYLEIILKYNQVPNKSNNINSLEQMFENSSSNPQAFIDQFNKFMDELEDVALLGKQGLQVKYYIANGYVVKEEGTIDINVDLAEALKFGKTITGTKADVNVDNVAGKLSLKIDYDVVTSNINKPIDIQIPAVNESNSYSYVDMMKALMSGNVRLAGYDGFETARIIGEEYNNGQCSHIILTSGITFPDALTASILSQKYNAPILLTGTGVADSSDALEYIAAHANADTKFMIIGGTGIIGQSLDTELINRGFTQIERLGGFDCYETSTLVAKKADVKTGTPVIVTTGERFQDSLSVASYAASKQYPILLVSRDVISDNVRNYLADVQPTTVYMIGGVGAVSQSVEAEVKKSVPSAAIYRLAGNDCFDTAGVILSKFIDAPSAVYLSSGINFQDALAGSALAARTNGAILLIDPYQKSLPPAIADYLKKLKDSGCRTTVRAFGGSVAVPEELIQQAQGILN